MTAIDKKMNWKLLPLLMTAQIHSLSHNRVYNIYLDYAFISIEFIIIQMVFKAQLLLSLMGVKKKCETILFT